MKAYPNGAHGVPIFEKHLDIIPTVTDWLVQVLKWASVSIFFIDRIINIWQTHASRRLSSGLYTTELLNNNEQLYF